MIHPIKYAELYAPMQRTRENDMEQNRKLYIYRKQTMMQWFYALMVVVIVGGIAVEAFLEKKRRRRKNVL